ncbi:MAG: LysR family transcriptional regulator [Hespellia sp.]|nr:LysR family transcriptional regulator [Hespellia sp.]
MDVNKYALFADIAETRNFTKSGERMGYTQPGVSHILKAMENELGFPLFLRSKQGVTLTPNARDMLPLVRKLLAVNEQLEQTIASINGLERGHLIIASFVSISRNWLPSIIYEFRKEYPGIEIELLEGGTDDIVGWVENSIADFGLLSKKHASSLNWLPLYEDPLVAVLPETEPYISMDRFSLSKMKDQPFIISAEGTDYDVHAALIKEKITPNTLLSSKDDSTIVSMVANHLGISILPSLVVNGAHKKVKTLPLEPYYSRQLGIGMRTQSTLTPAARHFIEYIQATLPDLITDEKHADLE